MRRLLPLVVGPMLLILAGCAVNQTSPLAIDILRALPAAEPAGQRIEVDPIENTGVDADAYWVACGGATEEEVRRAIDVPADRALIDFAEYDGVILFERTGTLVEWAAFDNAPLVLCVFRESKPLLGLLRGGLPLRSYVVDEDDSLTGSAISFWSVE